MDTTSVSRSGLAIFLLLSAIGFSACSPQPQDCVNPKVLCVGLVTDYGGITTGIQHEAWQALVDAKAEGLVDRVDRIETIDARDRLANIDAFASQGYDAIVTVGSSISAETVAAAQKYPNLLFIGVEQPQATKLSNLTGLIFHEERSGFLAGALAAMSTRTGRVAAVCEAKFLNPIRRYCDGFQAGVNYADPAVSVSIVYRDGPQQKLYQDTTWGTAQAADQVQQGSDVIFAAGGDTAAAALDTAAAHGALVIGSETDLYADMSEIGPELLTCSVNYVDEGVRDLLRLAREGRFPGGNYFGRSGLSPFHDLEGAVPASTRARLLQIEQALDDGSLQPDIPYDNPSD